jgi:hypothetical protein
MCLCVTLEELKGKMEGMIEWRIIQNINYAKYKNSIQNVSLKYFFCNFSSSGRTKLAAREVVRLAGSMNRGQVGSVMNDVSLRFSGSLMVLFLNMMKIMTNMVGHRIGDHNPISICLGL